MTVSAPPPASPASRTAPLDRAAMLVFAPMDKLAFGVAVGTAAGVLLFALAVADLLLDRAGRVDVALLSQFFAGYREGWGGAVVGLLWGLGVGFVIGWFTAFVRNLVLALWLVVARARADLAASRDFLDHI